MDEIRTAFSLLWPAWVRMNGKKLFSTQNSGHTALLKPLRVEYLLRWYLLLWSFAVYLWGVFALWNRGVQATDDWHTCLIGQRSAICTKLVPSFLSFFHPDSSYSFQDFFFPPLIVFTVLVLLHGMLLWMSLSQQKKGIFIWFAFPLQEAIILSIGFLLPQVGTIITLSLLFTLLLEYCTILSKMRIFINSVYGSSLLFLFLILMWKNWDVWSDSLDTVTVLILFMIGFLLLYLLLSRAHKELTAAHVRLTISAEHIEKLTLVAERQRLARELHDTLAQGLVGLILQLETMDSLLMEQRSPQAQEIGRQAMQRARAIMMNARRAIDDLRANQFDEETFLRVLHEEIQLFTASTHICCRTDVSALVLLPSYVREHVLRMISEGLTNISRHSHASHAFIQAYNKDRSIILEITDDGIGFDPLANAILNGHYGLLGLRERANLLNGSVEIESTPGEKTTLRFSFPYTGKDDSFTWDYIKQVEEVHNG